MEGRRQDLHSDADAAVVDDDVVVVVVDVKASNGKLRRETRHSAKNLRLGSR